MTEPSTLQDRIQASKPVDEGWTNRVYETSEGTIIKVFSTHFFEAVFFGLADILHGKLNFPFRNERLQKEVDVKNSLSDKGYKVPEIIEVYPDALEQESGKYKAFREGFEEAYRKFNRPELFFAVIFSVFTSMMGLQPYRIKRTLVNGFRL